MEATPSARPAGASQKLPAAVREFGPRTAIKPVIGHREAERRVISTIGTSVMPRRRAADSRPIAADQDQINEAELGDRGGNLGDLFARMRAGIAGVGVS